MNRNPNELPEVRPHERPSGEEVSLCEGGVSREDLRMPDMRSVARHGARQAVMGSNGRAAAPDGYAPESPETRPAAGAFQVEGDSEPVYATFEAGGWYLIDGELIRLKPGDLAVVHEHMCRVPGLEAG